MKRILSALVLILLLLSSCDLSMIKIIEGEKASEEKNTFIIEDALENPSSFTLLLTTDPHFGRLDDGVFFTHEIFFDWIKEYQSNPSNNTLEQQLTHMVCLGDITENASTEEFKTFAAFKKKLSDLEDDEGKDVGIITYTIQGNHDIRPGTNYIADWKNYVSQYSYQAFAHRGVSFYLLNTASRALGRIQMKELREAVEQDKRPKLFFSHMPLYGKASLIYFVIADAREREAIIRLMVENKGMLFLSGHHHQGDVSYSFRRTTSEYILGALHGRSSCIEQTKPRWYLLHFNEVKKEITITRYQVESDKRVSEDVMAIFPCEL